MADYITEIKEVAASEVPRDLLLQADPSKEKVEGYLRKSKCYIEMFKGKLLVHVLLNQFQKINMN